MIILSFFTNLLILLFYSWPFPHIDELGVSQTSRGKSQLIKLIINLYFFSDVFVPLQMSCLFPMSWLRG